MKSPLPFLLLSILPNITLLAQGNVPQPTHIVTQIAPGEQQPLVKSDQTFNYYDNNEHLYETKTERWYDSTWNLDFREYYSLNAAGKPTQILTKKWVAFDSTLINNRRSSIEYHANGQENLYKEENWNSTFNSWQVEGITSTTFTPTNKTQMSTSMAYLNGTTYGFRYLYSYDVADRISFETYQSWNNGAWVNKRRTDYAYNGANHDYAQAFVKYWDEMALTWGPVKFRNTQTVTNTQRLVLNEEATGSDWAPSQRTTTQYDSFSNILNYTTEAWYPDSMAWLLNGRYDNTYNPDHSISQNKTYLRNYNTGIYYNTGQKDYDYGLYPVSTNIPLLPVMATVSPNPSSDFIWVEVDGNKIAQVTLLDLNGTALQTTTASNIAQLSLIGQPAGVYFLRVEQSGATKVLPVVKI